jgi:hypothetical protein
MSKSIEAPPKRHQPNVPLFKEKKIHRYFNLKNVHTPVNVGIVEEGKKGWIGRSRIGGGEGFL